MVRNKFYLVFKDLDRKTQKHFQKYLLANHSGKQTAIKIYSFLLLKQKNEALEFKSTEELFRLIFGSNEPYNYRKLADSLSDLYLIFEDFLIWDELTNGVLPDKDFILLEIFKKKHFEDLYQKKINQIEKRQASNKTVDIWNFFSRMKLNHYQYFYSDDAKFSKKENKISEAMDCLDLFFTAAKLRYSCELRSRENILQENHEIEFLDQVISLCQSKEKFDAEYFKIYSYTLKLINDQEHEDYLKLKQLFFKNIQIFQPKELMSILSYLINFSAMAIKKGNSEFINEAFQLYELGLEKWVFIENNYMPHTRFNNIINIACNLKKFDWANRFIERWQFYLEKKIRKSAIEIGNSRLYFEQGKHDLVIDKLSNVEFSNPFYSVRAKLLLIRSHCELRTEPRVILYMCNAFENYIRRSQRINPETKKGFINFAKAVKKIVTGKQKKETIRHYVESLEQVAYKDWLVQKIRRI